MMDRLAMTLTFFPYDQARAWDVYWPEGGVNCGIIRDPKNLSSDTSRQYIAHLVNQELG